MRVVEYETAEQTNNNRFFFYYLKYPYCGICTVLQRKICSLLKNNNKI